MGRRRSFAVSLIVAAVMLGIATSAPAAAQSNSACTVAARRDTPDDQIRLYTLCLEQGISAEARAAAHNNRGLAYRSIGDIDKALEDFSNAIVYDDDWGSAYLNRAFIHLARNDYDAAEADLDNAVRMRPARIRSAAFLTRAQLKIVRGDRDGALADIAEATERARRSGLDNNRVAWLLATHPDAAYRNADEAVRMAERAVDIEEDNLDFRDTLAAAYAEAGRFEDAVREQSIVVDQTTEQGVDPTGYVERLALYQAGAAYRDTQLPHAPQP